MLKPWIFGVVGATLALTLFTSPSQAAWVLEWSDEFNGTSVDTTKWVVDTRVRQDANNTTQAVTVQNGYLQIKTYTENGKDYSGYLTSVNRIFNPNRYIEARIRFSSSPGMWSAFWLNSPTNGNPVGNPTVAGVEVDIVEHRGYNQAGSYIGGTGLSSALHWDGYGADIKHKSRPLFGGGTATDWHKYQYELWPNGQFFYYDWELHWQPGTPYSGTSENVLLTSEIVDGGWSGNIPSGGYGTRSTSQTYMQVDYVRIYKWVP